MRKKSKKNDKTKGKKDAHEAVINNLLLIFFCTTVLLAAAGSDNDDSDGLEGVQGPSRVVTGWVSRVEKTADKISECV